MSNIEAWLGSVRRALAELEVHDDTLARLLDGSYSRVTVVNAGLLKAGKSSLFNALIDVPEHFATSAGRCTTKPQELDRGTHVLVDTPGIDATGYDTRDAI